MLKYMCKNASMAESFETKWFETADKNISGKSKYIAVSLQLSWSEVKGTPDGIVSIEFSNDRLSFSVGALIDVDNTNNRSNAEIAILNSVSKFFRIRYINNSITNGNLDAVLYLEER